MTIVELPRRARGQPSKAAAEAYEADVQAFCRLILEINSTLDFEVGSRGWAYILEGKRLIDKGDFDAAERLIVQCRKDGHLPVDICAEDSKRAVDGLERLDTNDIEAEAQSIIEAIGEAHLYYRPISFWDELKLYIEIAVEKADLKSLFDKVAREFHIPIQNVGGWADLNVRAGMMRRFAEREAQGKQCALLYCGDHDPGGLNIADAVRKNLEDMAQAVGWSPARLHIDHFGLHYDFIEANGLTWIDNLETGSGRSLADPHHADHWKPYVQTYLRRFGARKVEANALVAAPEAGRELCRQAILYYIPDDAVQRYEERLAVEREALRAAVAQRLCA